VFFCLPLIVHAIFFDYFILLSAFVFPLSSDKNMK